MRKDAEEICHVVRCGLALIGCGDAVGDDGAIPALDRCCLIRHQPSYPAAEIFGKRLSFEEMLSSSAATATRASVSFALPERLHVSRRFVEETSQQPTVDGNRAKKSANGEEFPGKKSANGEEPTMMCQYVPARRYCPSTQFPGIFRAVRSPFGYVDSSVRTLFGLPRIRRVSL